MTAVAHTPRSGSHRRRRRRKRRISSSILRRPTRRFMVLSALALSCVVVLAGVEYWPSFAWPIATLVTLAPAWLLLTPYAAICIAGLARQPILGAGVVLLSIPFLLNFLGLQSPSTPAGSFSVVGSVRLASANLGNSDLPPARLRDFLERHQLDVLVLQEINQPLEYKEALLEGYFGGCSGHVCVVSKWPTNEYKSVTRRNFDDWGVYLTSFEIEHPVGRFLVADVHLRTPRSGIQALLSSGFGGLGSLGAATKLQAAESATVRATIDSSTLPVIVAGDFNMTSQHPLFRRDWSGFLSAHRQAGSGLGYTKYTRWHGVRIDHVLASARDWRVRESFVVAGFGGDHRPVVAELVRINSSE